MITEESDYINTKYLLIIGTEYNSLNSMYWFLYICRT